MNKYIQTPEIVKNLFLTFYPHSIPALKELSTEPMLIEQHHDQPTWLWIVSDKIYLTYFAGVFNILDKLPVPNNRIFTRKESNNFSKINFPMAFQWEIYPAEYFCAEKNAKVQNFVLELTASKLQDDYLMRLYQAGVVFEIFDESEITEVSLIQKDKIAEKLLLSHKKKNVEVVISYRENKFWAESDICPEGALAENSLGELLEQIPDAIRSFVSDGQPVYKYTLPALLYSVKDFVSFSAIANYVGVDQRCIYDYAYGKRYPKADKLAKILKFIRQTGEKLLNVQLKEK